MRRRTKRRRPTSRRKGRKVRKIKVSRGGIRL